MFLRNFDVKKEIFKIFHFSTHFSWLNLRSTLETWRGGKIVGRILKIKFSAFDWYQKKWGYVRKKWRKKKLKI